MDDNTTRSIRDNYDTIADEYARRLFHELQQKPLDRQLLARFAAETDTAEYVTWAVVRVR